MSENEVLNVNEILEVNANGAFITPQMAAHAATLWNEKNPKNGVAYVACSERQLRKIESLYANLTPSRTDVVINKSQQIIAGIPIRVDKFIVDSEIQLRDKQHRVIAKIVTLEK
jgi:hypothetical protein